MHREQRFPVVASAEKRGRRVRGMGGPGQGAGIWGACSGKEERAGFREQKARGRKDTRLGWDGNGPGGPGDRPQRPPFHAVVPEWVCQQRRSSMFLTTHLFI